jgi:hypothetical protein
MRNLFLTLIVVAVGVTAAPAQGWAEKMFTEGTAHDFGNVPRGAQLCHRFPITNIYAVRMEITAVQSGCGCVTASVEKRVLEPLEKTVLEVNMDARRFTGPKTVVVKVTVGPDHISTAEVKVSAHSRSDVVFNPGEVSFGTVSRGQAATQAIEVEYAGVQKWEVTAVVAKDTPLLAEIKEKYRRPGQVGYELRVTLKPDAPAGNLKQEIFLKTNDPASPLLPVLVEATVQAALEVTPPSLSLGAVPLNKEQTRRVLLKGAKPFRILGVEGAGDGIECEQAPAGAAAIHTVTIKCQFKQAGDIKRELKLKTDLQDAPVIVTIDGTATQ